MPHSCSLCDMVPCLACWCCSHLELWQRNKEVIAIAYIWPRSCLKVWDVTGTHRYHIVQAELNNRTGGYKAVVTDDHLSKGDVINLNEIDPEKIKKLPWLKEPKEAKF